MVKSYGQDRGWTFTVGRQKIVSHRTERFHREVLLCLRTCVVSRKVRDKRGGTTFSLWICFFHRTEEIRKRTLPGFGKNLVSTNFVDMRGRGGRKDGVSRFPVAKLLSHMTKKLRKGTFRCLEKLLRSKNVREKRGVSAFSVRIVLSHSIEKFRKGWIPEFRKLLASKTLLDKREGWTITTYPQKFFLSEDRMIS